MREINNHVHSTFSFSPYPPAVIPDKAKESGLATVGIMDHDTVSGCGEFLDAARRVGIAATAGCELRVNMDGTLAEGRKTNNPDEPNVSYIALHGIPRSKFAAVTDFVEPIRKARLARDEKEVERLNAILRELGAPTLDFDEDVVAGSEAKRGGTVTERHILHALSLKLMERLGKGERLVRFVEDRMRIAVPALPRERLLAPDNPHYAYDLLGVLKSTLVSRFYIPTGGDEIPNVRTVVDFADSVGAIPAYAYLGDVDESPTGDKQRERFEDSYLDLLVPELVRIGFKAVTYMPPRNTKEQIVRLQKLCRENGLMEISGVDVNSSRQSFNCPILLDPEFAHLGDAAYALVAHEKLAAVEPRLGMFHPENPRVFRTLEERIAFYSGLGRRMDPTRPEKTIDLL